MNDTDAVSCLLCLRPDEYGSMIRVSVPSGQNPPAPEKVICRLCASTIALGLQSALAELPGVVQMNFEELADRPLETKVEGAETDETADYVSGEELSTSARKEE